MEFVEGTGLDALVSQRGPLPVAEACEVIRQAALGLQHLHEHGLVHRDVKPSNLMLTPSGLVKVIDLGLARMVSGSAQEGQISVPGQFLGTLDYMAPEQCDDCHTVDIRADIYSLGCTLYHLLAGGPPFAACSSPYKKLKAHVEAPAPPIREQRPDIPDQVAAALERMLAKDRNGRYATPAEGGAALLPFAKDASLPGLLRGDPRHRPMAQPVHTGDVPPSVGVLHSFSGTMVLSEAPVADATLLAIEEINAGFFPARRAAYRQTAFTRVDSEGRKSGWRSGGLVAPRDATQERWVSWRTGRLVRPWSGTGPLLPQGTRMGNTRSTTRTPSSSIPSRGSASAGEITCKRSAATIRPDRRVSWSVE